jgi:hypothetical protein
MIFFVTLKFLVVSVLAGRVVTAMVPPTFQIHPNGNKNKCLDVRGAAFEDNTPVDMSAISESYHLSSIDNFLDTIATVLALKIGGFSTGRPRSDWRAPTFASTLEPVRALCPFCSFYASNSWQKNIDPSNNTPMKIYTCYDNLQAQQWYYTNDKRIALEGQGRKLRYL